MLDTLSVVQMEALLDQFSVPMLVLECQGPDSDFDIICVNAALEELADRSRHELLGRSILEFAGDGSLDDPLEYYQRCIRTRQTIRFAFLYGSAHKKMRWNKTLQYARSPDGNDRVIATAMRVPLSEPLLQDQLAFEDVRYFSSIADLQLENLSNAFSSASQRARVTPIDEERIMRLHAVCRTIQSTVADIKQVVRAAQTRHSAWETNSDREASPRSKSSMLNIASPDTIHTLSESCLEKQRQQTQ